MALLSLNGELVESEQARVSVFDRGLLFGDGLFETIRAEQGRALLWREHLDRLFEGLDFLQIRPPLSREAFEAAARELLERLGYRSARMRIAVTRGLMQSPSPVARFADLHRATVVITASELKPAPFPGRVRCALVKEIRRDDFSPLSVRKTLNYLASLLARELAARRGAQEAILTDTFGFLSEASMANLFWLRGDQLYRPSEQCGALPGVTAGLVCRLAQGLGGAVQPVEARPEDLAQDDLPFLTNAIVGMARVESLDDLAFCPSPQAQEAFGGIAEAFRAQYPIASDAF